MENNTIKIYYKDIEKVLQKLMAHNDYGAPTDEFINDSILDTKQWLINTGYNSKIPVLALLQGGFQSA